MVRVAGGRSGGWRGYMRPLGGSFYIIRSGLFCGQKIFIKKLCNLGELGSLVFCYFGVGFSCL